MIDIKLTKKEFDFSEKIFLCEIENKLPFQSKSKILQRLQQKNLVEPMIIKDGNLEIRGYNLTHLGTFIFGENCKIEND